MGMRKVRSESSGDVSPCNCVELWEGPNTVVPILSNEVLELPSTRKPFEISLLTRESLAAAVLALFEGDQNRASCVSSTFPRYASATAQGATDTTRSAVVDAHIRKQVL